MYTPILHTLQVRHKRIHSGLKPFQCAICGKSFTQSNNLYQHQIIHTGKKPFKCKLCNSSFTLTGNLQKHIQRTHPQNATENGWQVSELAQRFQSRVAKWFCTMLAFDIHSFILVAACDRNCYVAFVSGDRIAIVCLLISTYCSTVLSRCSFQTTSVNVQRAL